MTNNSHSFSLAGAVVMALTLLGTNVIPTLAQTKQIEPMIVSQNNSEIPMKMNHDQHNMANMQTMMNQMQTMMTKIQEMMANMTPEEKKAHEKMMSGQMHEMMTQMQQIEEMMHNHNSMTP